jgi:acyl-CoA thioester hydrolase
MSDARFVFSHRLVVRFADCDMQGHVNHATYFTYLEQCRLSWWRSLGAGRGIVGTATSIVHAECDYEAPAFVHEEIEIRLALERLGTSSVTLTYEIVNVASGQRLATGRTVNVTLDAETQRPIPVPESTRALLAGA